MKLLKEYSRPDDVVAPAAELILASGSRRYLERLANSALELTMGYMTCGGIMRGMTQGTRTLL